MSDCERGARAPAENRPRISVVVRRNASLGNQENLRLREPKIQIKFKFYCLFQFNSYLHIIELNAMMFIQQ